MAENSDNVRMEDDPLDMYGGESDIGDERKQEICDLQDLMALPAGRRFMWRLLAACGVFRPSYQGDAERAIYNEGRRGIGIPLLADIVEHCPGKFELMQKRDYDGRDTTS